MKPLQLRQVGALCLAIPPILMLLLRLVCRVYLRPERQRQNLLTQYTGCRSISRARCFCLSKAFEGQDALYSSVRDDR